MIGSVRKLPVVVLFALVSACNPFATPFYSFSLVSVSHGDEVICPQVRFRAEFAGQIIRNGDVQGEKLLDGTWIANVSDAARTNITGAAGATTGWPHSGAPFDVRVECLDEAGELIGVSRFQGRLITPLRPSSVSVRNYPPTGGDAPCLPPTEGSGVTLCAVVDGFILD